MSRISLFKGLPLYISSNVSCVIISIQSQIYLKNYLKKFEINIKIL